MPTSGNADKADSVFSLIDRELWLITCDDGRSRGGLIATFVSKASIAPEAPRMLVGLAKQHHTCDLVQNCGHFALHLLWPHQQDLIWRFGLASGRDTDKFAGVETRTSGLGNPVIPQALAWMDCAVETRLDVGDRVIFVADIRDGETLGNSMPMTVNRLYATATQPQLARLDQMYRHDSRIDLAAIREWREAR